MSSKTNPPKWWKDYQAECDAFDNIVGRSTLPDGATCVEYRDGSFRIDDGRQVLWLGPAMAIDRDFIPRVDKHVYDLGGEG